jgi:hypothetical protein
VIIIILAN